MTTNSCYLSGWRKQLAWRYETRDVAVFRGLAKVELGGVLLSLRKEALTSNSRMTSLLDFLSLKVFFGEVSI